MKLYHPKQCKMEYHPDDTPENYLPLHIQETILKSLRQQARTEREKDTLEFIRKHENSQRMVATGEMDRQTQKILIDGLAANFCKKHGDWVHVVNPIYKRFYELVQETDRY
jgi:hypothetical protein